MENIFVHNQQTNFQINNEIQIVLENSGPKKLYEKGDIIYYQGDFANSFYYLSKGKVNVFMTSPEGIEKTLNTAQNGEILGEAAFFDKMPRVSSAKAVTKSEIVVIDRKKLIELIRQYPRLAMELLENQAKRIRMLSSQIDSMTFLKADERIAQLLLQYKITVNKKTVVHLTHEEIGNMAGVSRVTVSKILNRFCKRGYIKTNYREIEIKNQNAIEQILSNNESCNFL